MINSNVACMSFLSLSLNREYYICHRLRASFAASFVLICCLREFPLSCSDNRFELTCQSKEIDLIVTNSALVAWSSLESWIRPPSPGDRLHL